MKQLFHVYECEDCIVTFAVEQAFDDQSAICCPVCSEENLRDVASGEMVLTNIKMKPDAATSGHKKNNTLIL